MAEPMTPEREAKARAHVARMQDLDAELTRGDYFARDLLAEVDRLRARDAERESQHGQLRALYDDLCGVLSRTGTRLAETGRELDQARAELEQWKATFGESALRDGIARLKRTEAERDQARAELDQARQDEARALTHLYDARAELAEAQRVAATVRASRDEIREKLRQADAERDRLAEHAQRVRSMHAPVCGGACGLDDACECEERDLVCGECWNGESGEAHPCRTVRALDGETGGRS